MVKFSIVVNFIFILFVFGSSEEPQTQGEKMLSTPIKIGEQKHLISFPASIPGAEFMARKFCTEKAAVGLEEADIEAKCITPIGKYLVGLVEKDIVETREKLKKLEEYKKESAAKKNKVKITLEIAGKPYKIEMDSSLESPSDVSREFCVNQMSSLGLRTQDLPNCIHPVEQRLTEAIEQHLAETQAADEEIVDLADTDVEHQKHDTNDKMQLQTEKEAHSSKREISKEKIISEELNEFEITESDPGIMEKAAKTNQQQEQQEKSSEIDDRAADDTPEVADHKLKPPVLRKQERVQIPISLGKFEDTITYLPGFDMPTSTAMQFCVKNRIKAGLSFGELRSKCVNHVKEAIDIVLSQQI